MTGLGPCGARPGRTTPAPGESGGRVAVYRAWGPLVTETIRSAAPKPEPDEVVERPTLPSPFGGELAMTVCLIDTTPGKGKEIAIVPDAGALSHGDACRIAEVASRRTDAETVV